MEAVGLVEGKHYAHITEVPLPGLHQQRCQDRRTDSANADWRTKSLPLEFTWPFESPGCASDDRTSHCG